MKLCTLLVLSSLLAMFSSAASAAPLKVGDAAPVASATTDAGVTLNLADVYAKNTYTLVWFYPKALTGGCTKQGCSSVMPTPSSPPRVSRSSASAPTPSKNKKSSKT